jgi:hypothetical protein|nr:hypothetical protein [Neorhizobium tomejilense]
MAIDISALKQDIASSVATHASESDRRREEYARSRKLEAESYSAVCTMLFAARLKDRIAGFPDKIDLGNANGYRAGYGLEFRNGIWHVILPGNSYAGDSGLDYSLSGLMGKVVAAMGIPHSSEAISAVRGVVKWDLSKFSEELASSIRYLPHHTVLAIYGGGWKIAEMMGFEDRRAAALAFANSAYGRGITFAEKPTPNRPNLLARLANNSDAPFLDAAVEVCRASVDRDCLFAAVNSRAEGLAVRLINMGVPANSQDGAGDSALHLAVRQVGHPTEIENAYSLAKALVSAGVPLGLKNCHGTTAAMLLDRYADDLDRNNMHDYQIEALEALAALLSS